MTRRTAKHGEIDAWVAATLATETDACIVWPFAVSSRGYGGLLRGGRWRSANNYVCELAHGPAPTPKHHAAHAPVVCHTPLCCNKRHLRWATHEENQQDRRFDGTDPRGERNGNSKITEDDVREIRQLSGFTSQRVIASMFGISQPSVSEIVSRQKWAHIQ